MTRNDLYKRVMIMLSILFTTTLGSLHLTISGCNNTYCTDLHNTFVNETILNNAQFYDDNIKFYFNGDGNFTFINCLFQSITNISFILENSASISFIDCMFQDNTIHAHIISIKSGSVLTLTNTTFNNTNGKNKKHNIIYAYESSRKPTHISIYHSTFNGCKNVRAIVDVENDCNVYIENTTFKNGDMYADFHCGHRGSDIQLNISNCTFESGGNYSSSLGLHQIKYLSVTDSIWDNYQVEEFNYLIEKEKPYDKSILFKNVNLTNIQGGGIRIRKADSPIQIEDCLFDNIIQSGSCIYLQANIPSSIKRTTFKNCSSHSNGGAIYAEGPADNSIFEDLCFENNMAKHQAADLYLINEDKNVIYITGSWVIDGSSSERTPSAIYFYNTRAIYSWTIDMIDWTIINTVKKAAIYMYDVDFNIIGLTAMNNKKSIIQIDNEENKIYSYSISNSYFSENSDLILEYKDPFLNKSTLVISNTEFIHNYGGIFDVQLNHNSSYPISICIVNNTISNYNNDNTVLLFKITSISPFCENGIRSYDDMVIKLPTVLFTNITFQDNNNTQLAGINCVLTNMTDIQILGNRIQDIYIHKPILYFHFYSKPNLIYFTVEENQAHIMDLQNTGYALFDQHQVYVQNGTYVSYSSTHESLPPTVRPTATPTITPTNVPTITPTKSPTTIPTVNPTQSPRSPTDINDTLSPSINPTNAPVKYPTITPTITPTKLPTVIPTINPTRSPTDINDTLSPSINPTNAPTKDPTELPTNNPTNNSTIFPTINPTTTPTVTQVPKTTNPPVSTTTNSSVPTNNFTTVPPTTSMPTTQLPTNSSTTQIASTSISPTDGPVTYPVSPSTSSPTTLPYPTFSTQPTQEPTVIPLCDSSSSSGKKHSHSHGHSDSHGHGRRLLATVIREELIFTNIIINSSFAIDALISISGTGESKISSLFNDITINNSRGPMILVEMGENKNPYPAIIRLHNTTFESNSAHPPANKTSLLVFHYSDITIDSSNSFINTINYCHLSYDVNSLIQWNPYIIPTNISCKCDFCAKSVNITESPTWEPTPVPTNYPTLSPSKPTKQPLKPNETHSPTTNPTSNPTCSPTSDPTSAPTYTPTTQTTSPSNHPTNDPTLEPTLNPSFNPTPSPIIYCKDWYTKDMHNGSDITHPPIIPPHTGCQAHECANITEKNVLKCTGDANCYVDCDDNEYCVKKSIIVRDQKLTTLTVDCRIDSSCKHTKLYVSNSTIDLINIWCVEQASCRKMYIDISFDGGDGEFNIRCLHKEACGGTIITLSQYSKATISCEKQFSCSNLEVHVDENVILNANIYDYSDNIRIHTHASNLSNINVTCFNPNDTHYIFYDTTRVLSESKLWQLKGNEYDSRKVPCSDMYVNMIGGNNALCDMWENVDEYVSITQEMLINLYHSSISEWPDCFWMDISKLFVYKWKCRRDEKPETSLLRVSFDCTKDEICKHFFVTNQDHTLEDISGIMDMSLQKTLQNQTFNQSADYYMVESPNVTLKTDGIFDDVDCSKSKTQIYMSSIAIISSDIKVNKSWMNESSKWLDNYYFNINRSNDNCIFTEFRIKPPEYNYLWWILVIPILKYCICIVYFSHWKLKQKFLLEDKWEHMLQVRNPLVVIIPISEYDNNLFSTLTDLENDIDHIKTLFEKLKYTIRVKQNMNGKYQMKWSASEIEYYLKMEIKKDFEETDEYDALVVFFSCHGIDDCIVSSYERKIQKYQLTRLFAPGIRPRMFFFDCCSEKSNKSLNITEYEIQGYNKWVENNNDNMGQESLTNDFDNIVGISPDYRLVEVHGSITEYLAFCNQKGSLLITHFANRFRKQRYLENILTDIEGDILKEQQHIVKIFKNKTGKIGFLDKPSQDNKSIKCYSCIYRCCGFAKGVKIKNPLIVIIPIEKYTGPVLIESKQLRDGDHESKKEESFEQKYEIIEQQPLIEEDNKKLEEKEEIVLKRQFHDFAYGNVSELRKLFKNKFGYEIWDNNYNVAKREWTKREIYDHIKKAQDEFDEKTKYDAIVVYFSCHSVGQRYIVSSDYWKLDKLRITREFRQSNCPRIFLWDCYSELGTPSNVEELFDDDERSPDFNLAMVHATTSKYILFTHENNSKRGKGIGKKNQNATTAVKQDKGIGKKNQNATTAVKQGKGIGKKNENATSVSKQSKGISTEQRNDGKEESAEYGEENKQIEEVNDKLEGENVESEENGLQSLFINSFVRHFEQKKYLSEIIEDLQEEKQQPISKQYSQQTGFVTFEPKKQDSVCLICGCLACRKKDVSDEEEEKYFKNESMTFTYQSGKHLFRTISTDDKTPPRVKRKQPLDSDDENSQLQMVTTNSRNILSNNGYHRIETSDDDDDNIIVSDMLSMGNDSKMDISTNNTMSEYIAEDEQTQFDVMLSVNNEVNNDGILDESNDMYVEEKSKSKNENDEKQGKGISKSRKNSTTATKQSKGIKKRKYSSTTATK
eukprot:498736_1